MYHVKETGLPAAPVPDPEDSNSQAGNGTLCSITREAPADNPDFALFS